MRVTLRHTVFQHRAMMMLHLLLLLSPARSVCDLLTGGVRGGDRRLIVAEAAGHVLSVTEKRWIITLIHQTNVNRCQTVPLPLPRARGEASQ